MRTTATNMVSGREREREESFRKETIETPSDLTWSVHCTMKPTRVQVHFSSLLHFFLRSLEVFRISKLIFLIRFFFSHRFQNPFVSIDCVAFGIALNGNVSLCVCIVFVYRLYCVSLYDSAVDMQRPAAPAGIWSIKYIRQNIVVL